MAEELPVEAMSETPAAKPKSEKSRSAEVMQGLYWGGSEESFQVSTYYPDSYKKPFNPDTLVEKDYTYGVYEEMLKDDQVDVALKIKKDLVVGSGWYIDTKNAEQGDIKEDLENSLDDHTDRPLSEILNDIIQAYEYGFSISEKLFYLVDGKLCLKDIKPRHPSSWLLHTDDHGNMVRYEQRGPTGSIDINPDKIIHYINNEKFQNPYGRSDLYAAYQAYMTKRHITRYYAIYLENAAGPKPVAKFDRRAPAESVTDIYNAIKSFQTKTALVIPKEFEVEFLEAKSNGEAYIKGINLFNMFIGRALFIPDLLGFQGSETGGGSYSLGQEQIGLFYKHIQRRRQILERIVNQHIIKPIVTYNYGLQEDYPKFKFLPLSDADASKQADMWIKAVNGVGWQPTLEEINHFRELVKFPKAEELEMKGMAPVGGELADKEEEMDGEEPEEKEDDKKEKDPEQKPEDKPEEKQFKLGLSSMPGDYKKRVDFKMADNMMKNSQFKILDEAEGIEAEMFEDLYQQIKKINPVKSKDVADVEQIGIREKYLKKLDTVFRKHFRQLFKDSQIMASAEIKRSDNAKKNERIPSEEFMEVINQETYKYLGDYRYGIDKDVKNRLIAAVKDGRPLSDVVDIIDTTTRKKLSEVSLERYARTKTTEVFNRGRMAHFNETGIVSAYQFAAILDDVTSDICGNLHGLTFPAGTAPVPPLHFNCRSVLVPITKYEEWSEDGVTNSGKNVDKFLEEEVADKGWAIYSKVEETK